MKRDDLPGSSTGLLCNHGRDGCVEGLQLSRTTAVKPSHEDDWRNFMPALYGAVCYFIPSTRSLLLAYVEKHGGKVVPLT